MSHVAALHFIRNQNYVHNYYGPYAYCSLDKGVAYTRGGGGGIGKLVTKPMPYVAALNLYGIKLGTKFIRSLRLLYLGQERRVIKRHRGLPPPSPARRGGGGGTNYTSRGHLAGISALLGLPPGASADGGE